MDTAPDDPLGTCLLWLAKRNGVVMSPEALLSGLPLSRGRLRPAEFVRAAEKVNMAASIRRCPPERINPALLPCVATLDGESACLVLEIDRTSGQMELMFPELEDTRVRLSAEDFSRRYGGAVFYCQPMLELEGSAEQVHEDGHWFWSAIRQNRAVYRDVLIAALFVNLMALVMPLFVMNVYDRVVPNQARETLWVLAAGALMAITADLALRLTRTWFVDLAATRADVVVSARIMQRVLGQQLENRPEAVGAFTANVQAFETVRAMVGSMTVVALVDLPFFLLFALIIGLVGLPLVVPVLVGAAVLLLYAFSVQARMHRLSDAMNQASSKRNAVLVESLSALETVKAFNGSGRLQNVWEQTTRFLAGSSAKLRLLGSSVSSGAAWIQQLVSISIIVIGVYLIIDGQISQGGLIAAYLLSSRAMAPISQTAGLMAQFYQASIAMDSVEGIMQAPQEGSRNSVQQKREWHGAIEFHEVSFTYPGSDKPALDKVSFTLEAKEKVALLGTAGCGKSTVARLLLGLYQPQTGSIFIDGINIAQIDPAELRRRFSYVPQETRLLQGSVYDNISLGNPSLDEKRLLYALNVSGLAPLVGAQAQGLSMPVGEGGERLSGGQRQAVVLARAVAREAGMVVLDEPTSAMDSSLEAHVRERMQRHCRSRTLLLITHRAPLLELVDRLIVLDAGQVVADGHKAEVLAALASGSKGKRSRV